MILTAESSPAQDLVSPRAEFKALTLLGPSVLAAPFLQDFRGNPQNFGKSESHRA